MYIDLQHDAVVVALALIASAAVRALPDPEPNGNKFYLWLYRFAHGMLSNYDKLRAGK